MLKFGKLVDLEKLEKMGVNRAADEFREKIQRLDKKHAEEMNQWDLKIRETKQAYLQVLSENTRLLENMTSIRDKVRNMEQLYQEQQAEEEYMVQKERFAQDNAMDKLELQKTVNDQRMEIYHLQAEINDLLRKTTV
jgi:hypothetical protein